MTLDNPKQKLETRQEQVSTQPDPKNQVIEDLDKRSEQTLYTKRITRIEGGNLRGGAPGRGTDGERTVESTEKAVKTIHKKFHPNTVISFENTADDSANTEVLAAEKKTWTELGVKFIELPVAETELNKLFEKELQPKTLEAFNALDNGGTFVHCTHGLQRARAFTEIWRATRGIDRRKAIQENPNFKSGDHKKCGETAQEIIEKILKNPLEARAELSKEVAPTPEATQPSQSTEHLSEKSKELQKKLEKEIEKITEEQRKQDEQKLSQAEIKDIRFNTALLNGNEDKVKEEMTHRLAQYTEKQADGGLKINYSKFNASGRDHEMNIGLGDIMPPEYKRIIVMTSGGNVRVGKRELVNTSHETNRVGYVDESTGGYLATFTGDTIYVLDPPLTDEKELSELLAKEKEARKTGAQNFSEYTQSSYGETYPVQQQSGTEQTETVNMPPEGPLTQETIGAAAKECSANMKMEQAVQKQNLMKIIDYVAREINIPPYALFAVLSKECSFRFYPPVTNLGGAVVGMAQHKISGWEDAKKQPIFQRIMSKFTSNPLAMKRAENILADILSAAIRLRDGIDYFGYDINYSTDLTKDTPDQRGMTRAEWIRVFYKRPGDAHAITRPEKYSPERRLRAEKSLRGDREAFTRYLNYTKRAKSILDRAYGEQPKAYASQQPPQSTELAATGLTPKERAVAASIRSMPKPNFDYDAVYVLGCGATSENRERAVAGAELALKNHAAFLTSGGATSEYRKMGTTEGRGAYSYIMNNPYYRNQFVKNQILTGIEDQSKVTGENIDYAVSYLKKKGFKRILVVTTESGYGTRSTHGTEGRNKFDRKLKGEDVEVSFYTPERPNIDRNMA